jgi:hypothetical protein
MIGYYPINPAGSSVAEDAFGPQFFRTHFVDRMRQVCLIDEMTPVLEFLLTSGQVIDVAHIVELKPDYMLVSAFVDTRDCAKVYHAYIRYMTIYRINVLSQPYDERPIGFSARDLESVPAPVAPPAPVKGAKKKAR